MRKESRRSGAGKGGIGYCGGIYITVFFFNNVRYFTALFYAL